MDETALLAQARAGDAAAFEALVAPYRGQLHAHCYRMLGSLHDADDALQETLLAAWKGIGGFEGRGSLLSWLYRIATHAAIRLSRGRPGRVLSLDRAPATTDPGDLGEMILEPIWLEPYPDSLLGAAGPADPAARYAVRESVELAFVAALQHLPPRQRAVLVLRDVLVFSAAEVATVLGTSVAAVNSALQRARTAMASRDPVAGRGTRALDGDDVERLVTALVAAWERADVEAILELLVSDAVMTMPPLPAWFDGRDEVGRFLRERVFQTPWRARPATVNGQPAVACYQLHEGSYRLGALMALTLRDDRIASLTAFLPPMLDARFDLPEHLPAGPMSSGGHSTRR